MKTYKLKDNKKVTRKDMVLMLDWCKKFLGRSKYFSVKTLKLRTKSKSKFLGQFAIFDNTIEVNPLIHDNIVHLIETIIHEYVHFQQNPREFELLERKYNFNYYYDHPHEYEAESTALKLSKKCYKNIKNKLS